MVFITTMTWNSVENQVHPDLTEARGKYLAEQHHLLNTDYVAKKVSDTVTRRQWFSIEAAEAWKAFLLAEAAKYNITVQVEITEEAEL